MRKFIPAPGILLLLVMLVARPATAAIALVQDAANASVAASTALTMGSAVTLRNMLVACVHSGSGSATIADGLGNTWKTGTPNADMAIFWTVSKAGADTITVTCGGSGNCAGVAGEISGMGTAPLQDGVGVEGSYATRTVIQTNTLSTSGLNPELVIGCGIVDLGTGTPNTLVNYGAGGGTPTGFTHQGQSSGETIVGALQSVSTTGPFGFQWTTASGGTTGALAAFEPNTPAQTLQSQCPNGAGLPGVCNYPTMVVNNLNLEPCPASTNCTGSVSDQTAACAPGVTPVGSGSNFCWTQWNGAAWLDF